MYNDKICYMDIINCAFIYTDNKAISVEILIKVSLDKQLVIENKISELISLVT